jgi:hypothetical protein
MALILPQHDATIENHEKQRQEGPQGEVLEATLCLRWVENRC